MNSQSRRNRGHPIQIGGGSKPHKHPDRLHSYRHNPRDFELSDSMEEVSAYHQVGFEGDDYGVTAAMLCSFASFGSNRINSTEYPRNLGELRDRADSFSLRRSRSEQNTNSSVPNEDQTQAREDVSSFLNRAHQMFSFLFAGSEIGVLSHTFLKTGLGIIRLLTHKSLGLLLRLTGWYYLKKLLLALPTEDVDVNTEIKYRILKGRGTKSKVKGFGFKKFLKVIRIVAFIGKYCSEMSHLDK